MAKASEVKSGNVLRFNGELVSVEEYIHRTPGNLRAFYQARMRNVKTGKIVEYRFRGNYFVHKPLISKPDCTKILFGADTLINLHIRLQKD